MDLPETGPTDPKWHPYRDPSPSASPSSPPARWSDDAVRVVATPPEPDTIVGVADAIDGREMRESATRDSPIANAAAAAAVVTPTSPSPSSPSSPDEAAAEIAYAAVSEEAVESLRDDGFAVLDDVLPADVIAAGLDAANALERSRRTVNVGQEGRDDSIAVLAGDALPAEGTMLAGLSPCARTLLAVPAALRRRRAEMTGGSTDGPPSTGDEDGRRGTGRRGRAAAADRGAGDPRGRSSGSAPRETMRRLATATAPDKLMLANYPGDGARYVAHLDNDPGDPRHSEGEPGLRASDRAVTAILYLNPDWEESHGGCLRVHLEGPGGATVDVAPSAGRMVLFDCRRIVHEVLPSHASRWAMTAWIND
uniref:Fe2OG dioxygenase domain-containing protein n=1 Tax=Micromonas pusilla TaxID=38833 RepID=A0A7S0IMP4_MICPS|mmetsp:Transcript_9401/g.38427  ORF Transcript_9401/g.38427 Transcript_9401/m.38427 type:complete len:366 (+) Transcript_9401:2038-3135(+)